MIVRMVPPFIKRNQVIPKVPKNCLMKEHPRKKKKTFKKMSLSKKKKIKVRMLTMKVVTALTLIQN